MGICLALLVTVVILRDSRNEAARSHQMTDPTDIDPSSFFLPEEGCVPDDPTAVRIAEAVLRPNCGPELQFNR